LHASSLAILALDAHPEVEAHIEWESGVTSP